MSKLLIYLIHLLIALFSPALIFAAYYPPPLYGQASAYINSKLYIFGGTILNIDKSITYNYEIFYLDLSKPFNTTSIHPWYNESTALNISHVQATACVGGALQDNIFVFEGQPELFQTSEGTFAPLIYMYDIQQKKISEPQLKVAANVTRRRSVQAVCNNKGKMYIFGGLDDFTSKERFIFNRMDIFNTIELLYEWTVGNVTQSGGGRFGYSAVFLNDNERIVYIGGILVSGDYLKMNDIYIYNTNSNQWSYQNAGGIIPGTRESHSAVITSDNRIIVYGGAQATPQLAVLTITNELTFTWSTPEAKNPIPVLYSHSANLINSHYMLVTFGYLGSTNRRNDDIYILDTSNSQEYSWITSFEPNNSSPPVELTPDEKAINSKKIWFLGSIIGSIAGCTLCSLFVWCVLRRKDCCNINNNKG